MATRQELYTAIGLIRQTCLMNRFRDDLILHLRGLGGYSELEQSDESVPSDGLTSFGRQKRVSETLNSGIYDLSGKIHIILEKTDDAFLNAGINVIPVPATRQRIASDSQTLNILSMEAKPFVQTANKKEDLAVLSVSFESHVPECGIDEPDPWKLFPGEVNYANILHDILDAMSYELQGKNSYTGQSQYLTNEMFQKLIGNRLFTANRYLNQLPNSADKQNMAEVVSYVEANFNEVEAIVLGHYIDSNIPKQIMFRRWWAL